MHNNAHEQQQQHKILIQHLQIMVIIVHPAAVFDQQQPESVTVNPHLALISHPALGYPSLGRGSTLQHQLQHQQQPMMTSLMRGRSGSVLR